MKKKKKIILITSLAVLLVLISSIVVIKFIKNNNYKNLTIKLKGKEKVTLNYGEKYKDEGVTVLYKKKDISKKAKTIKKVNYKKLGTNYYIYKITYKGITKSIKRKIKIVDKTNPEIKLNGDEVISILLGSKYEEEGATATDNYDKDITKNIKIDGSVDSNKVGEYTITYSVEDSSKNKSEITRKVVVYEKKTTPVVTPSVPTGTSSKGYKVEQRDGIYYVNGILIANKTYPLPSNYNPGGLTSSFQNAFNRMQSDAASQGISLRIISGFRSYNTQKTIYNNYVARDGQAAADRYSARPGHSEHQTGLAADINSLDQSWENTNEGRWLNNNCYKYGFIIRYVKGKESSTGYMFEPWHIRYVGEDLAKTLYNGGNWITLEEYLGITSKY